MASTFRFGWLEADVCVAAFDPRGFARDEIVTRLVPDAREGWEAHPPADLAERYSEARAHWKQKADERVINNEVLMLALKGCRVLTDADAEEREKLKFRFYSPPPRLLLEFILSTYVEHRSASSLFQSFEAERKFRELGVDKGAREWDAAARHPLPPVKDFWSNSFGVQLALITSDNKMVYGTRSMRTAVNPGGKVLGVVEGMDQDDVLEETGLPDPYHAAARGLLEEQGITYSEDSEEAGECELRLTALILNVGLGEWNMIGYYRNKRGLTSEQLLARRQAAAKDAWEYQQVQVSDFTPAAVAGFIKANEAKFVNYAKVGAVLALLANFPEGEVRAAFGV